jgi:WD40 repeat protein
LLAERDILLVIDDVWDTDVLKPFLNDGKRSALLITTRIKEILPANTRSFTIDVMYRDEAVQLLCLGVEQFVQTKQDQLALHNLATQLGNWPLLLKLVNAALREYISKGETLSNALTNVKFVLNQNNLVAYDVETARNRTQTIEATMQVNFKLLTPMEYTRFWELAIFPEDIDIPLTTVQTLWGATGGLDITATVALCRHLHSYSLLLGFNPIQMSIRLHDIVRTYIRTEAKMDLAMLNARFLEAYGFSSWAELPSNESYLWENLAYHLLEAGRSRELATTVKDPRYLARKTLLKKTYAVESDLLQAELHAPTDTTLHLLKRSYSQMSHLLNQCRNYIEVATVLHSRLLHLNDLTHLSHQLNPSIRRPYLTAWHALPDLPNPALIRTLRGHWQPVNGCAVSPDGDWIVSASDDTTLKLWDSRTGAELRTLQGHRRSITSCAVSPDGDWIVSASKDQTLKVWDSRTGAELRTLQGHRQDVNCCAVSPDGAWIVSASGDGTLKVWDSRTGAELRTLWGHRELASVTSCAVSPDGTWIVSASDDGTLKLWDSRTRAELPMLQGHIGSVYSCAVSPKGDWVVSASWDGTLKMWDTHKGVVLATLKGHKSHVLGCAVSPDGTWIASISDDKTLKLWDSRTRAEIRTLNRPTSLGVGCAVSPDGTWIVSAWEDQTFKVFDSYTGTELHSLRGHRNYVTSCAVSPDGTWIVSASKDHTLKLWDAHTGAELRTLRGHTEALSSAVSPDGTWVVSAFGTILTLWDVHTGTELRTLQGHTYNVNSCAISPDGAWIVSTSWDGTFKLWDTQTGICITTFYVERGLNYCAFCPDGEHLIAVGDGGVYFLQVVR